MNDTMVRLAFASVLAALALAPREGNAQEPPAVAPAPVPPPAVAPAPAPVALPPVAPPPEQPGATKRFSTPLMVTGIVTAGVGAAAALTGIAVMSSADTTERSCSSANETLERIGEDPIDCGRDDSRDTGTVLTILGLGMAAVGVPLAIIGGHKVPAHEARVFVAPTVGGARAGFGLRF